MNNELGRKITSLTLMTIMVAGGMTFAIPGVMPAAHAANANLFVSAENSQFDNYMSGPQVIEVVVIDSDINDTDEAKGEPDVTVNGKKLRMTQAVDGNWYGYFADRNMALIADSTVSVSPRQAVGLNFGVFCSAGTAGTTLGFSVTETSGVALPLNVTAGDMSVGVNPPVPLTATNADCASYALGGPNGTSNVVREAKDVNINSLVPIGQIGYDTDRTEADLNGLWPFVQLYTLNPTGNVVVQYNKGGGVQTTTLTFDTVDNFAGVSLDRANYPQGSQVHATITDLWLNIDPTDEDSWTWAANSTSPATYYQVFDENGAPAGDAITGGVINIAPQLSSLMCEDNCVLLLNTDVQSTGSAIVTIQDNEDSEILTASEDPATATTLQIGINSIPVTVTEQGPNSGVFGTYDEGDKSAIKVSETAPRGKSASIDYNESPVTILVGFGFATIDIQATDDEWNSGEEIPIVLVDSDANKNSRADEDLDLNDPAVDLIPALRTGDPFTLGETGTGSGTVARAAYIVWPGLTGASEISTVTDTQIANVTVQTFSQRAIVNSTGLTAVDTLVVDIGTDLDDLHSTVLDKDDFYGFNFLNIDVRGISSTGTFDVYLLNSTTRIVNSTTGLIEDTVPVGALLIADDVSPQSGLIQIPNATNDLIYSGTVGNTNNVGLAFVSSTLVGSPAIPDQTDAVVADFFSFGFVNDGLDAGERIANQLIRLELEETGDNTSTFAGSLEFIMVNQINILDANTYLGLSPIADDPSFIVIEDLTDEDSPRVNYLDLGADGVSTQVADQQEAPSHSGIVSFDQSSYKNADTVTITLEDADLNVDSDLIDIYTTVSNPGDPLRDIVGSGTRSATAAINNGTSITLVNGELLGRLLDVTFDDLLWTAANVGGSCSLPTGVDSGLAATGFTLIETGTETGIFVGDFQIPSAWCRSTSSASESVTGLDIEVNYVDFRDASGETIEVGDGAGVRANTGSVSLDRTVYPVPFGIPERFATPDTNTTPNGRSVFPVHQTAMDGTSGLTTSGEFLSKGGLTVHVRVNDPDFDISASGEDAIAQNVAAALPANQVGPVKLSVIRGSSVVVLGYAGGPSAVPGEIDVGNNNATKSTNIRQFGPMEEIAPDAGIFESDILIRYTDGPASSTCPDTTSYVAIGGVAGTDVYKRFDQAPAAGTDYCILQGDILQVEYTDPADASGDVNTVTDSATFDLRNGVLQSDKSVYIIGSDMILTLIEPDLDLDNDQAETYSLDLIEWDSDAATISMGTLGGSGGKFDPEPLNFRETGDSTGIFQIVIEIPDILLGDKLERGEEIVLEYTDWGPSGSDYVGDEDEDVNLTIFTSNFGATVELDQKVYSWTDKVYITIVAPDHNFDSNLVDEIGDTDTDPIKISTRGHKLNNYKLVETGTDTGIFTGEVILTGFVHDADGKSSTGDSTQGGSDTNPRTTGSGPTSGYIESDDDDGITVSFEFSEDETVVGSSLIRWNIGEVQWLEASYPASGTGVVRIIDPDMNLDPESVDNFDVDVWSDSDAGGIDLTVTETNEATGIFEGTVFFTVTDESSGHRLRVAEGDTVTAEYEDNTLPDPYTTADELDITATSLIGTVVPPLERAPASNLRTVDAFGNSLSTVKVDQQVQITADLANGQDREQQFAYLVQIQDGNGVTVSLAWITGSLSAGQSFSPALSWIPDQAGTYSATAFVWESVDNPTALSPPVSTTITVS
ncbi:MAG: hypothetical protein K5790_06545 [Nitrosopumilus sp.]|uniref:hypothetical protein n=1 Tax=Nitrosopumilus sp. TaxID=2024843 RepID=UPI00247DE4E1|nr:hypothetical protein [Nitrosopumilus sp.]MCV0392936.1 hypothetical protein [Nitrosopumilus sp.]